MIKQVELALPSIKLFPVKALEPSTFKTDKTENMSESHANQREICQGYVIKYKDQVKLQKIKESRILPLLKGIKRPSVECEKNFLIYYQMHLLRNANNIPVILEHCLNLLNLVKDETQ
jgi:hypothetical protein